MKKFYFSICYFIISTFYIHGLTSLYATSDPLNKKFNINPTKKKALLISQTFNGLGSSDSGGSGFKTITNINELIVSNNLNHDGTTLYGSVNGIGATEVHTIKADGIDAESFDLNDLMVSNFTGTATWTTSTIEFKDKNGNTLQTMSVPGSLDSTSKSIGDLYTVGNTLPVTGVAEIIITISGGTSPSNFTLESIDISNIITPSSNTAPVIGGTSASQSVNDNSAISPFSSITTTDADGDNLSATITLDNDAKGVLTGTGLSGTGPYTIASTTPADLQAKLRALSFNPTDNRTATSETTTFTVVVNDGTVDDTDNTTTVISSAVAPAVSSVSVPTNATYVTGQNLDFTVNFDENVTVNTTGGIPQIAITIGATIRQATYISGSGTSSLVFRHTVLSGDLDTDGIAIGSLATNGSTLKDAGGKDANLTLNNIGSTTGVLVDAVAPTISSVSIPNNAAKVGDAITVTIIANEPGLLLNTGLINGTTVSGLTDNGGGNYTATYTVVEGNTDRAAGDDIPVNFILTDAAGNNSSAFTTAISQNADAIDANSPSITNVSIPNNAAKVGDAITVTITANEAGLLLNTGLINGTTVSGLTDNGGGNYTATYTVVEGNTDRAAGDDIPVNFILTDAAGNNSSAFTTAISQNADAIDANSPSITNVSIPNNAAKVGDAITVTITANEAGLLLNTGLINGTTVSGLTDNGGGNYTATYTVVEGNADRAAGDDIPVNFILTDAAGNNSSAFTTAISQNADAIDANSPSVSNVSVPSDATYTTGQNLDFTVNFNENTNVNTTGGTPQIAITIGTTTRQAVYLSGSGTSALVFRYTVQSEDLDTDGIVVGTLALNGGTLKDTATNDANLTLNSVGSTTAVLVGSQNFTWTGATDNDWNTASNWDLNSVPSTSADIVIPSGLTNYPTASSAVTFNSLTINNGASFIPQSTVTGTITYKRNLPTTNWYLVSPPVAGETLEDIIANHTLASGTGGNLGLAPYSNITGPAWLYVQSGNTGTVTNGTGVSIKLATPGEVSISGTANTSNVTKAISTGSRTNYNLVGNPYTSYINSASFTAANSSILTSETIWLWNGTQYTTRNAVNPIEIAPGQGFFVEAAASNNVIFAFSNQSHQNSDTFMRQEPIPSIELSVNNNDIKRSTQVFYVSGKTTGYDRNYDSKMFGEDTSGLAVFTELLTNNQGKQLAIQTLPDNDYENMVVPVGLRALNGEEVTFSINTKNIPTNIKVYLEDRINNVFTNLSEENYTITLNKDSNSIGQFYLHTSSKNLEAPAIIPSLDNVSIYNSSNNEITIVGLQAKANVSVYSVLGKEILNKNITSNGVSNITLPKISTGIYIVKLNSDLGEISKKIILK
ncbi:T9SS type A sorting domain-containing protein [Tenacibaculum singaporense]|uniref:T9SS type A sorting domain-containing protein n=1 Tax=Tenacibaculum singaporense TaxID=2358479 RepID=UPI000F683662|nr:T9SS type A sorting domain-containing protein [Tenacibaculum singaporense]RSC96112.1 T9SS C-terminal target domain-containing protein [Tenacibaculum singaporense]